MALLAALEVAADGGAGVRGERRASAQIRSETEAGTWVALVETASGPGAPLRTALSGALERQGLLLEGRLVPGGAGFWLAALAAGIRRGEFALTVRGKAGSLGRASLRGAGVRLEWEHELSESTHGGAAGEAWALSLSAPVRGDPWLDYGQRTLDWSQRASAGLWIAHDFGAFALTPSVEVALPPQDGAFEVRATLAAEVPAGSWKLRAQTAVARAVPALWLAELAVGVSRSWP